MRQIIHFKTLPSPKFRYSPCVRTGPHYEFSGMIGLNSAGQLHAGGTEGEARQILKNMLSGADELGLGAEHLVSATIYCTRFSEFGLVNKAWEEVFDESLLPPARTSVGVSELPLGAAVEMSFRFFKEG